MAAACPACAGELPANGHQSGGVACLTEQLRRARTEAATAARCATRLRAACEVVLVPNLGAPILQPIADALELNCAEGL